MDNATNHPSAPCRLYVGTSGYAFPEWVEAGFYPPSTPHREMITYYAQQFNAIELNQTWYQIPRTEAMTRMLSRVPAGFVFSVKLTRTMTHEINSKNWLNEVNIFRQGIAPLTQAGRLLAILVQLGPEHERNRENRMHLARLLDELSGLPVAVEFRHRSWANDNVFWELERRRVTLVSVDMPDLPNLFPPGAIVATNPELSYSRLHGRNLFGWRGGHIQKQNDYDYAFEELQLWSEQFITKLALKTRCGAIFFTNHIRGQAPRNAQALIEQLAGRGYEIKS